MVISERQHFPFDDARHAGSATTSTTSGAPDLLPLRRIPSHRICYNVDDGPLTRSATPSMNPVAPALLQCRRWQAHRICYPFDESRNTGSATLSSASTSSPDLIQVRIMNDIDNSGFLSANMFALLIRSRTISLLLNLSNACEFSISKCTDS